VCVGARGPLVAYNLVLEDDDVEHAEQIAKSIRSHSIRALGLQVGSDVQVSCNLVEPWIVGPAACYDAVAALSAVRSAELVGLMPRGSRRHRPESLRPTRRGAGPDDREPARAALTIPEGLR
jgi:glutamate formiminotransferase